MFPQQKSLTSVAILFTLTAASTPSAISVIVRPVLAQSSGVSASFPVPQSVPNGTQVQINGTTSMERINNALAERFKAKYSGTDVKIAYDGTDASLKALPNGKIDLAAIGRPLTQAEKAQGLVSTPLGRDKIAVIVGKDNPFKGSLTSNQFAKIFRGEITNWSQVGGSPQAIRLIDRPKNSDLRQAFKNYPVFQKAPFTTGANAVQLSEDSTQAVTKELGVNGIGYVIADQAINNPNVHIVLMHDVPPTDPRYPFSQPLLYAYRKSSVSPAAAAFLGYATAAENKQLIKEAVAGNAIATAPSEAVTPNPEVTPQASSSPVATASPATTSTPTAVTESPTAATESQGNPWWWLLLIPLLGGLLWWLLSRRRPAAVPPATIAAPVAVPPVRIPESRIILTPRNCRDAYAYWEVPNQVKADLQRQGGRDLKLRLYDATDLDIDRQRPHSVKDFDCDEQAQDLQVPIAVDDRDYIAELGYFTDNGRWLTIARSAQVRVPRCEREFISNIPAAAAVAAGVTATGVAAHRPAVTTTKDESRVILVPRNSRDAYAYWELPETRKTDLRQQGGRKLVLRVYDATGILLDQQPAHSVREFSCDEQIPDLHIPMIEGDRDYVAELGYITDDGRWLKIARSAAVKVPSAPSEDRASAGTNLPGIISEQVSSISKATTNIAGDVANKINPAIAGGAVAVAGIGSAARGLWDRGQPIDGKSTTVGQPTMKSDCRIILVPYNFRNAYAYWEVSNEYKADTRRQGGRRFVLRVHEVTNLDINNQPPHMTQEYVCDEHDQDKHVSIPVSDRDYIAEVGYYTDDNRWLGIIRSFHVHIPSNTSL